MVSVTVDMTGLDLVEQFARAPGEIEAALQKGLTAIAFEAQNEARRLVLKGPKTGRIYQRGSTSHQASAPGEAPANAFGSLVQSILAEAGPRTLETTVGSRLVYALHLELGTRAMAARPFLAPAARAMGRRGPAILDAFVKPVMGR